MLSLARNAARTDVTRRLDVLGVLPFVVLVAVWYVVSETRSVDPVFLPSPGRVADSFVALLSRNFLYTHLLPSFLRVSAAFLLSAAVAFPIGVWCGQTPAAARAIEPICGFTRYLPVAALVPLCILWFGVDHGQKVAVIVVGVVFQLVLLFAADTSSVPQELVETGKALGLSRYAIVRRIVLPQSMPAIWQDMRISAGWAWSYLVLAELVAGNRGVGYFVIQSQRYLETERVFAGILFIGLLGLATDVSFRVTGKRLFPWA